MTEKLLVASLLPSCPGSQSPNPKIPQMGSRNSALPSTNTSVSASSEILVRILSLEMGTGNVQLILRWPPLSSSFQCLDLSLPQPSFVGSHVLLI